MHSRAGCAAAAAVLALPGCGGSGDKTKTVDDSAVEKGIESQLSKPNAEVTSAKCPSDVKSETGATFKCSVKWSNGATGKVKVTQTSPGHFTYEPVDGSVQVPGATVEKSLKDELGKQGAANATVDCPGNIVVKVGSTVTCKVSGAGGKAAGAVTFTFSSAEGTVDPSSVKTG